jgi:atypical dual specificity phosphatase
MALDWTLVEPGVIASRYPVTDDDVGALADLGVRLLINLHEDAHDSRKLQHAGVRERHIPIGDFGAPQQEQIDLAIDAIEAELSVGHGVAVHCAYGVGRTGAIIACWLVSRGMSAEGAIRRIRELRPGSVEMPSQERAVHEYARLRHSAAVQSERGNP